MLIYDPEAHVAIGNSGWVDKGGLWIFQEQTKETSIVPVADADFLTVKSGTKGFFVVVHHHSTNVAASIRRFEHPDQIVASVKTDKRGMSLSGDASAWSSIDRSVLFMRKDGGPTIFQIDTALGRAHVIDTSWFNSDNYDLMYQTLVSCLTLPTGLIVIGIQRSSNLIIVDPFQNRRVGKIPLADRGGNPDLLMRTGSDFLASDYDTLCRVDIPSMVMVKSALLQEAKPDANWAKVGQFMGDFDLRPDGRCVLARPYSSDVLLLDSASFEILSSAHVDGQPLDICAMSNGKVLTRDWQSGEAIVTQLAE